MSNKKTSDAELIVLILQSAEECATQDGLFMRGDCVKKLFKIASTSRTYRMFEIVVKSGEIANKGGLYALNSSVKKNKELVKKTAEKHNITPLIIAYLNERLGTAYKSSDKAKSLVSARVNDGAKLDDFYLVIDKKVAEWKDTPMEKYLRPITLFGTKFEGYLNQLDGKTKQQRMESMDFERFFND